MRLIEQYGASGGLPGACFIRNPKFRAQKVLDQLDTILDRDLRQVHETTLTLPALLQFLRELALRDGTSVQHQELRRATGITSITQKKLLYALEALFFEDHAEVAILARDRLGDEQKWSGLLLRNLREQMAYRIGENAEFFQYRTRAGVCVPFALRTPDGVLGFIPIRGAPSRAPMAAAYGFLRKYANGKVVLVTDANETRVADDRTILIPATRLLFAWP
jgi:hypothetical protein